MSTSIIDGTVEEATFKRKFTNMQVWGPLKFRLNDGSSKTLDKVILHADLAPYIVPGNSGRFYCYAAIDHRGIHGVRTSEGQAVYAFAKNNEISGIACAVVGLFITVMYIAFMDGVSIWGLICILLGVPLYFLYRQTRLDAEKQFDADSAYVAPPAAVAAQ
jgi:hypothetical protein